MDSQFQRQYGESSLGSAVRSKKLPYLPPCRVCGNAGSGFHYGVNTCEACKGFYRRSIARETPYPLCNNTKGCDIRLQARSCCSACRYKKCLAVGMSKSAIKTGRYTIQKRTLYTLEIKYGSPICSATSSATTSSPTAAPAPLTLSSDNADVHSIHSLLPDRLSMDQQFLASSESYGRSATITPSSSKESDKNIQLTLNTICDAFRASFPNTAFLYEHFDAVNQIVANILKKKDMEIVKDVLCSTKNFAPDKDMPHIESLTSQEEVLKSVEMMNSAVSGDLFWDHSDLEKSYKELFEAWLNNIAGFVNCLVKFAKQLFDFDCLPLKDKTVLIIAARTELAPLIKMRHINFDAQAIINYHSETDTMVIMPSEALAKMFTGMTEGRFSQYHSLLKRLRLEMSSVDIKVHHLSILCALALLTPDREGLSPESRATLSEVEDKLVNVMSYSLSKTHPQNKLLLPKMLMLLPKLRELGEFNTRTMLEKPDPTANPELQELILRFQRLHQITLNNLLEPC